MTARPTHVTPKRWPDDVRARALDLADTHGPAQAARILADDGHDVPAGTIRRWRHDTSRADPPAGTDPTDWAEAKRAAAVDVWDTAQAALAHCRRLIDNGDATRAKAASVTLGVLLDKAAMLEAAAHAATEAAADEATARQKLTEHLIRLRDQAGPPPTLTERADDATPGQRATLLDHLLTDPLLAMHATDTLARPQLGGGPFGKR